MLARLSLGRQIARFSLFAALLFAASLAVADDRSDACSAATTVTLGSTVHDYGVAPAIEAFRMFKVEPAGPGVLTVTAASPGDSAQPKLLFLGIDCLDPDPEDFYKTISEGPTSTVVWIGTDDTFYIQVSPEDPEKPLTDVKLITGWSLDLAVESEDPEPVNLAETDPPSTCGPSATPISDGGIGESWYGEVVQGIQEWDGDVLSGAFQVPGILRLVATDGHLSAEIHHGDSCERSTGLVDGELADPSDQVATVLYPGDYSLVLTPEDAYDYTLDVKFFDLCPGGGDQGDTTLCAAELVVGVPASGAIDDGGTENDDDDYFTFTLAGLSTVEIESSGSLNTFGSLYDVDGTLIANDDDEGSGSNFRVVRSLTAGRYFVRVEGVSGAEDSYGLDLALVPEP